MILGGFDVPTAQAIVKDHPKFSRAIKGFLMGVDELPQDWEKMVPENVLKSSDTLVDMGLTTTSFRDLYDFFDGKGIYIDIDIENTEGDVKLFTFIIMRKDGDLIDIGNVFFNKRIEAETKAFLTAIQYYEKL